MMNRMVIGGLATLLMLAAGLFWWQGRAELQRGVPPPDLAREESTTPAPIVLPSAGAHGRGKALPKAGAPESAEAKRFNRYDKNRDGTITRNEMLATRVKAFQKLDTNHDNLLSFEEWAVTTARRFDAMDANHDGIVTRAEFDAWQAAHAKHAKSQPRCTCSPLSRDDDEDTGDDKPKARR